VDASANFRFNSPEQRIFIDAIGERKTVSFDGSKADIEPLQSHYSLIIRKLFLIFLFFIIAILDLIFRMGKCSGKE
jgi:hypothetical protein